MTVTHVPYRWMAYCATKSSLIDDSQQVLADLNQLIARQRQAVKDEDYKTVGEIDIEVEKMFGRKERSLGALDQHIKEHRC